MEIGTVGKVAPAGEERFIFEDPCSPCEGEDRTYQRTDGCARHAEGGDRAEAEDQECIQRKVHHIAADIRLHDDACASIAQLHRLQDECERGHVDGGKRDGAIRHGFCHVFVIRAHEVEDVIQKNVEKDVQKTHEDRAERERLLHDIRCAFRVAGTRFLGNEQCHRGGERAGEAEQDETRLHEDADSCDGQSSQRADHDEVGRSEEDHEEPFQRGRKGDLEVVSVVGVHESSCEILWNKNFFN